MNENLILNYDKKYWFQGFRENKSFIRKHPILLALDNEDWQTAKYMDKLYNISSPTRKILGRYFVNILSSILDDYANNELASITLIYSNYDSFMDPYSKKIFNILDKYTDVEINTICNKYVPRIDRINKEIIRESTKRGLYDNYQLSSTFELNYEYSYFKKIFFKEHILVSDIERILYKTNDNYYKWIFIKLIINLTIRSGDFEITEKYLSLLEMYKKNNFDYWNSKSFMLLVRYSKKEAIEYLNTKLDIKKFLQSTDSNYSESLVMKNYATLLDNISLKREMLNKCLQQTPQDVDLWKLWFESFPDIVEIEKKSLEIFNSGYSDLSIFRNIKVPKNMQDTIVRGTLLCSSSKNKGIGLNLLKNIKSKKLQTVLREIILNESDLYEYTIGDIV